MHVFNRSIAAVLAALTFAVATPAHAWVVYFVGGDDCPYHDIQSAVDAAAQDPDVKDYIWLSNTGTYDDQHVVLRDANIIIEGGFHSCASSVPDDVQTRINGTDGRSVLEFEGHANVLMANVWLIGASMGEENKGGGIYFGGSGLLELANVTIGGNTAGYGAGIDVTPDDGSSSVLQFDAGVQVVGNHALVSGGGVRLEGNARFYALQHDTWIAVNEAETGYGGGLEVVGPARADIGGSGPGGAPIIQNNTAQYGGGADVIGTDDGPATLRIFTTDAANPVSISGNVAYNTGGAVYLKPTQGIFSGGNAFFCAYDFRIEQNSAQEGAAIYADSDSVLDQPLGSTVSLNTAPSDAPTCINPEAPPALGAVACADGVACNRIAQNTAQQSDGTPADGSTLLVQTTSELSADRVAVLANRGGHVARVVADGGSFTAKLSLSNCLLADNAVSQELLAATDGDGDVSFIDGCTIAGNAIGAASVVSLPGQFVTLRNSIVDQPGLTTITPAIADPSFGAYVLATDVGSLPDVNTIALGEPTFVDAAGGDYHLAPGSLGIDFAPRDDGVPTLDLDRHPRVVDLPQGDVFGPMDLGAYEMPLATVLGCAISDTVFCNGFEP